MANELEKRKQKYEKYWKERTLREYVSGEKEGLKLAGALQKHYKDCLKEIEKEINAFYGKYATNNQITIQEAKKLLDKKELKSFKESIDDLIDYYKQGKQDTSQLKLLRAKSRVSRLEELKVNINKQLAQLANQNTSELQPFFKQTYEDAYYKTIYNQQQSLGVDFSFTQLNEQAINSAVAKNYNLANYSVGIDKVWQNTLYLNTILEQKIPQGLTLGYNPRKLARNVSKELGTNYNSTVRLIRTEYNNLLNNATLKGYKECGIEKYEILSTLDKRTCEVCGSYDGKIIAVSGASQGVELPPFHANCRCTTIPYLEPDEFETETPTVIDKYGDEVSVDITYQEWKAQNV